MTTLLITRGYPASGKTTLARKYVAENDNWARVNRDDLRFNLFGKYSDLTLAQEDAVTFAQVGAVRGLLNSNINVVVDDTNLNERSLRIWRSIRNETGCDLDVIDVETSVGECVVRDDIRKVRGERSVGKDVIYFFNHRYPMPWPSV